MVEKYTLAQIVSNVLMSDVSILKKDIRVTRQQLKISNHQEKGRKFIYSNMFKAQEIKGMVVVYI